MKKFWTVFFTVVLGAGAAHAQSTPSEPLKTQNVPPASSAVQTPESQGSEGQGQEKIETFIKTVSEVNLIFTVTDKRGRFIKGLTQSDFKLLDNKRPPAEIRSFRSETDLPLRVGLLIDCSESIRERFKFEQDAAIEFLNQIIRHRTDQAFVMGFDNVLEITQDFTGNTEKLALGVRALRPGGGTSLYDAIFMASRDKLLNAPGTESVRKAIILLSDGQDNQSRALQREALDMAKRAGVIIYAISTNVSTTVSTGDKALEKFATETGGRVFFPTRIEEVANAFEDIQDELRSQYAMAYKPADFIANGEYRPIEIKAKERKYRVRSRTGYYAPPK